MMPDEVLGDHLRLSLAEDVVAVMCRPESVDAARDKHSTRSYMAKAGLPTPRNMLIERPDQVEAAGNHVGFPAGRNRH